MCLTVTQLLQKSQHIVQNPSHKIRSAKSCHRILFNIFSYQQLLQICEMIPFPEFEIASQPSAFELFQNISLGIFSANQFITVLHIGLNQLFKILNRPTMISVIFLEYVVHSLLVNSFQNTI